MALAPGARLGAYEINAKIGAGGMGEVWRATDTNLGRQVAIKVLPDAVAHDAALLARFDREAKTLASLNHPNIAIIHGFEKINGVPALVMELVEGPTLADRIAEGAIGVDEALPIAKQIAEALEAAHEHGIVHRDLKPANVKVRPDGTVKVLDFGLAKAMESGVALSPSATQSPTFTSPAATRAGMILGTAAYMSPEQARGKPVDKRADIWAFGCVLYEVLTGKRAFPGENVADTLAAVVTGQPDWDALGANIPARVCRALRVCLQKDPRQRGGDIAAIRLALDGAFETGAPVPVTHRSAVARFAWMWIAVALMAGVLLSQLATSLLVAPPTASQSRRFQHTLGKSLSLPGASGTLVAIAPDGQTLAYRASENGVFRLYRRALNELDAHEIPGTENSSEAPFFSPDGRWVGFIVDGTLMKVSLQGGRPVRIADVGGATRGANWGLDDSIVVGAFGRGLLRVHASGGDVVSLAKSDDGRVYWYPQVLPGGAVLFTASRQAPDSGDVIGLNPQTGVKRTVVARAVAGRYTPSGHLVFVRGGDLWAVRFDPRRLEVSGDPVLVEQGIRVEGGGAAQIALADDGTLVYLPRSTGIGESRTLVWVSGAGEEEPLGLPVRSYQYASISPDGGRIALDIRDQENDIWTWDIARHVLTRFTFDPALDRYPVWTPDGRRIVFNSLRAGGAGNLYWQAADGTGSVERLGERLAMEFPYSMTPDGTGLVLRNAPSEQRGDLFLRTLSFSSAAVSAASQDRVLIQTPFAEANAAVAPDGRWLAYQSNESGRDEVYVRPFPNVDSGRWQVSTGGGRTPVWARAQDRLFYRSSDGAVMTVRVEPGLVWRSHPPMPALAAGYYDSNGVENRTFDVSLDGKHFLMIKNLETTDAPAANVVIVQNWHQELKRLVPTK